MNTRLLQTANAASQRVDGIDVGKLLRDLGEASATSNAVDLFGLCLNAQRVLTSIQDGGATVPLAKAEADLIPTYCAMNIDGRDRLCGIGRHMQKRFPCQRLGLTLVRGPAP